MFVFVAAGSMLGMMLLDGIKSQDDAFTLAIFVGAAIVLQLIMIVVAKKTNRDPRFAYIAPPVTVLVTMVLTYIYLSHFAP